MNGETYLCPICLEHGYHNHSDSEITEKAFSLRLKPILERAEKAEDELAALRARVTEFLDVYDRGEDFDALDRAEAALRAEVNRG